MSNKMVFVSGMVAHGFNSSRGRCRKISVSSRSASQGYKQTKQPKRSAYGMECKVLIVRLEKKGGQLRH